MVRVRFVEAESYRPEQTPELRRHSRVTQGGDEPQARKRWVTCAGAAAVSLLLTACATTPEPRIEIREVKVPIAVKCAVDPGPESPFSDTPEALRSAGDLFEKVKLLLAGRAQRDARLVELKAANAGCR